MVFVLSRSIGSSTYCCVQLKKWYKTFKKCCKGGVKMAKRRTEITPEAREAHLISLATDLAEKQLREGTASSQVITHYLKMGSRREQLEREILANQSKMMEAKTEQIHQAARLDEVAEAAIQAMRQYQGRYDEEYEDDDY